VLLEESKVATPLVEAAHLSATRCPHVPSTAMVFIFLPRISIFYIMTHAAGGAPRPYMRIPWPSINLIVTVEVAPVLNALVVVAGSVGAECRLTMKAWTILAGGAGSVEQLRLVERPCSQRVSRLQLSAEASVVFKEPAWAALWYGSEPLPVSAAQRGAQ
jgi:hypothetical protein